jgi:hypothetical protein
LTGATITDIDLVYTRTGADHVAKVDATALATVDAAHADNKAIEIDATSAPGLYRIDWPDAAFASGAREVILTVILATAFVEHVRVDIDDSISSVKAKTDTIGIVSMTVTSPVATDGDLTLYGGNSYLSTDGNGLSFTFTDYTGPNLNAVTGKFRVLTVDQYNRSTKAATLEVSCTLAQTSTTVTTTVSLTAVQTAALNTSPPKDAPNYKYQIRATVVSSTVTLGEGDLTVKKGINASA